MKTVVVIKDGEALDELAAFAERPENLYRIVPGAKCPGDDPAFARLAECVLVNPNTGAFTQTIRVVFSITEMGDGKRYRHASFSLAGGSDGLGIRVALRGNGVRGQLRSEGMPAPSAVETICFALGFEGVLTDWIVDVEGQNHPRPVVVVAQELSKVTKGDA